MTARAKPALAPHDEVQIASTDPAASAWVAANAGTGKTKVLTDRIVRLLLDGAKPSRILCLTFTKAAATEMRVRLATQLGRWATLDEAELALSLAQLQNRTPDAPLLERARGLFALVLDAPGGLQIHTIHSFCQSLLKRFPIESGIAPHFTVMEDRHVEELLERARQDLLAALASAPADDKRVDALAEISALIPEYEFAEAIGQMVNERSRIARLLRLHGSLDAAIADLRRRLDVRETDAFAFLQRHCADNAIDAPGLRRAAVVLARGGIDNAGWAEKMAAWLAAPAEQRARLIDSWSGVFFDTKGNIRSKFAVKKLAAENPWVEEIMQAEARRLDDVLDRYSAIRLWRASAAMLRLAVAILDRYRAAKDAEAQLDYEDLIGAARRLLNRPDIAPWVLYKLDGGIDHVLIDEAQDTNPDQWEVVQRLTEEFFAGSGAVERPRTLFVVGDIKQSIFSFQRADPRLFAQMRQFFAERVSAASADWLEKELVVSYRSTQPILDAVDAIFARSPAKDGLGQDGTTHKVSPQRLGDAGLVEIWPVIVGVKREAPEAWAIAENVLSENSPELRLARAIADHAARLIKGGAMLEARGRQIEAGDILILVRRRNQLVDYLVRELKARGVEVAGIDRMVLTEQLAVRDLIALGEFLLQPDDDLTLAAVLKSPLIGLDEEALMELAIGRERGLWQELRARAGEKRFTAAHAALAELLARVDFVTPYALYADLLGPRGARRALQARLGHDAGDPIDEFLALTLGYERLGPASLQGFLHWLGAGGNEIKRELDQARGQVRIMTVHGAKGLQAPIVYLPDTCQKPDTNRDRLLWPDDNSTLLWAPRTELLNSHGHLIRDAVKQRGGEEYRRLLYVALTRAADRLYVCGYWNQRKPEADCWYNLIQAGLDDERRRFAFDNSDTIGADGWQGAGLRFDKAQSQPPRLIAARLAGGPEPLPAWIATPAPAEKTPAQPLAPSRSGLDLAAEGAEPASFSPLAADDTHRFKRGLLIHRLLQSLPELDPPARSAAAARFLKQKIHGLDATAQKELARETLAVLDDPNFAALFGPHSRAEVPLAGRIEGRAGPYVVSGQIDRLCVLDERILIVDYKTNRPPPRRVEDVPALYLRQMAAYRAVLARIYPGRKIECLLLWTAIPELMMLPEALLEAHNP